MSRRFPITGVYTAMMLALLVPASGEYDGNLRPEIRTEQDDILAGKYTLRELFYRGGHIFTNRFTTTDGLGEAPDGPRRSRQLLAANPLNPFLRFNGLDAQSCLECHNFIGFRDFDSMSLPRELGITGGSAGVASSVMIFKEPNNLNDGIVRSPPHLFGLGFVQRLADEMTEELLYIRDEATEEALLTGLPARRALVVKGIDFGHLTIGPSGGMDFGELDGISPDLVVRPFQFKGIASTLRNFAAGALNFHFSVQARELMDRHLIPDDNPTGMLADDVRNEIMDGDVTALTVFVAALRPPMEDTTALDPATVFQGRTLFDAVGCAVCHVPSLRIQDPRVTILDPYFVEQQERRKDANYTSIKEALLSDLPPMSAPEVDSNLLAPVLQYQWRRAREQFAWAGEKALEGDRPPGYTFHLVDGYFPAEARPRLAANPDGTVDVPLFSDLKRHNMGEDLADRVAQDTEMPSLQVQRRLFLTRPLWGVADTGPWLHDGRATTLDEAIRMHAGEGSAANDAVAAYAALSDTERLAIREFLRSLRAQRMTREPSPHPSADGFMMR